MRFIVGIKLLAIISLILGLVLLFVCAWTFHSFWTKQIGDASLLNNSTNATTKPFYIMTKELPLDYKSSSQPFVTSKEKVDPFADIIEKITDLKTRWAEFKRFLLGSNGMALFTGFLQVITNFLMLCKGSKGVRSHFGCWKSTHFLLGTILIISLIVPAVFDWSQDSLSSLRNIYIKANDSFLKDQKFENFNLTVVEVYYGILALDITVIFVLVFLSCCLNRNADYDYEYT